MKKSPLILLFALLSGYAVAQQQQAQPVPAVGRYQLVEFNFEQAPGYGAPMRKLARIDTATGIMEICETAWRDAGPLNDGREYWAGTGRCIPFFPQQEWLAPKKTK